MTKAADRLTESEHRAILFLSTTPAISAVDNQQVNRSPITLHDRLGEDLKQAMKAKVQLRMDVIRMIKAAAMNKELELKKHLDDAEMTRIMTSLVKQRKDAVEPYGKAGREDLADKELKEIVIIQSYLPHALTAEEVTQIIDAVIQETGATSLKDMGIVMKTVMARLAGQAVDGKLISDLVRSRLR